MSVRVIIKDVKKRTKACDECKRRKGRCDGGMPCEWCSARNLECVFSAFSQKRGPKKKRKSSDSDNEEEEILTLDKREQGLSYDMELNTYLEMFMEYIDPLFTMFGKWDKSKVSQLNHPRSYSQFITKYTACAIAARANGQKDRASALITEARSFAGQCFDDMSIDGLMGFFMLGAYWLGSDSRITKHYTNIALSIYSMLPPNTLPANIRYFMTMCGAILNSAISDSERLRVYLATANTIVAQTSAQALIGSIIQLCMKTFAHMKCFEASLLRSDISAVLLCQVFFTEKQRQGLLAELQHCRDVVKQLSEINSLILNVVASLFVALEVFIEWRSGHVEQALPLAIEFANNCDNDGLKFGNRFDVEHLLSISIFLREQQHPALADKVRRAADNLHSAVCENFQELATSADPLASYLQRRPNSTYSLVSLTPPVPAPRGQEDPYNTIDDNVVPTMVSNVLSLVGQLLPSNNPKALLSAQGLHLFYNTLSSIIPPVPSPLDILDGPTIVEQSSPPPPASSPTSSWSSTDQPSFASVNSFNASLSDTSSNSSPPISPTNSQTYSTFIDTNNNNNNSPTITVSPTPQEMTYAPQTYQMNNTTNTDNTIITNNFNGNTLHYNNLVYTMPDGSVHNMNSFQTIMQQPQSHLQSQQLQKYTPTHIHSNNNSITHTRNAIPLTPFTAMPTLAYQNVPSPSSTNSPTTPQTPPTPPSHLLLQTPNTHFTTNINMRNNGFTKTAATYGIPILPSTVTSFFVDSGIVPTGTTEEWAWLDEWNKVT